MADGRHFENRFISISHPSIIRFWSNFVHICKFLFRAWKFESKVFKFKMADRRHIENWFLAVSWRRIDRLMQISEWRWRITCRSWPRGQNCNFRKFKMADGHHPENSFISISQPRIIRFWSNLVHRCKFLYRVWKFDKNRNFSNSKWRTDAILKIVFGYISAPYWLINAKFRMEMTNDVQI